MRRTTRAPIMVLVASGLVRLTLGDPWSLLTASIIGVGLNLVGNASKNMGLAQGRALDGQGT